MCAAFTAARAPSWPAKKTTFSARLKTSGQRRRSGAPRRAEGDGDEITLLRSWLDEAWSLRSKHEYDQVREVLERTRKQADLIRTKITVSKLRAQASGARTRWRTCGRRSPSPKALADTLKKKKAIEGTEKIGNKGGSQ